MAGLAAPLSRESDVVGRVERALQADPALDKRRIRRVMAYYLACRVVDRGCPG
jgi:hypothetical protein